MPAHVPDSRLRNRVRAEKRSGHNKGGNATWRTYNTTRRRSDPRQFAPPSESWWLGLSREAFQAAVAKRQPVEHPVILPDPDPA